MTSALWWPGVRCDGIHVDNDNFDRSGEQSMLPHAPQFIPQICKCKDLRAMLLPNPRIVSQSPDEALLGKGAA